MAYTFQWPQDDAAEEDLYERSQESIRKIATLQAPSSLPDWLTTNPDSLMGELTALYGKVPGMVDPRKVGKAFDGAIGTVQGMGGQIANNAATEAVARGGVTGGQINSSMAKAQAMLPVYDTTSKLKVDKAAAVLDAGKAKASIMGGMASTMANLRTNYLTALGNLHLGGQNSTNAWVAGQQQLLQKQTADDRQYDLSMEQLATRASGGAAGAGSSEGYEIASAAMPNGVSSPGYITNSGPIRPAMLNGQAMRSTSGADPAAIIAYGNARLGGGREPIPANMRAKPMSVEDWIKVLSSGGSVG